MESQLSASPGRRRDADGPRVIDSPQSLPVVADTPVALPTVLPVFGVSDLSGMWKATVCQMLRDNGLDTHAMPDMIAAGQIAFRRALKMAQSHAVVRPHCHVQASLLVPFSLRDPVYPPFPAYLGNSSI